MISAREAAPLLGHTVEVHITVAGRVRWYRGTLEKVLPTGIELSDVDCYNWSGGWGASGRVPYSRRACFVTAFRFVEEIFPL